MKYITLFETAEAYNAATLDLPNVSLIEKNKSVHYNPYVAFFCKLKLNDDNVVELEGSGELTSNMISDYKSTLVSVEIGTLCTSIADNAFNGCSGLTSINIPSSVTSIGFNAFCNCNSLTSIDIPDSVTSIGGSAFSSCSGLISIVIPNSVTSIGDSAFYQCSGLTNVTVNATIPPTLGTGAFNNNASDRKIYVPSTSVETYKTASGWNYYADGIQAIQ